MLAGLEEVSQGDIVIGNRTVTHLEPRDRDIAMVFQSYALYPHMSVYENIAFGLKNRGVRADVIGVRCARPRPSWRSAISSTEDHGSCPAANAGASRSAAPSSATPASS